jgi:PAS domain S-box-containing protein
VHTAKLHRYGLATLFTALAIVLVIGMLSYRDWERYQRDFEEATRARRILTLNESLTSGLLDAETGQRGFILTGDPEYLKPYNAALQRIPLDLQELTLLGEDIPTQHARFLQLHSLIADKLAELRKTIELRRVKGLDAALAVVLTGQGERSINRIRALSQEIKATEDVRREGHRNDLQADANRTRILALLGAVLLAALVGGAGIALKSAASQMEQSQQELQSSQRRTIAIMESMSDGFITFDGELRCIYINPAAARLFDNKTAPELLGKSVSELWPDGTDLPFGAAFRRAVSENVPVQIEAFHPEPLHAWFEFRCYPSPAGLSVFFTDITQRRRLEEARERTVRELELAVSEKTVLLKEVHHRVKNNLAVISSLLNMTAENTASGEAKVALDDSQRRVHSMALIHEHLYGSTHLDRIDFSHYVQELARGLHSVLVAEPSRISLAVDVDPIEIGIERAVPCALILNELLTNAFKYAFPNGRRGHILVSFHQSKAGTLELSIEDDGIGLPAGRLAERTTKSLGLRIVGILTKQLDGSIEQVAGKKLAGSGTRIVLRFMRIVGNKDRVPVHTGRDRG